MKKGGRLTFSIAGAVSLAYTVVTIILLSVAGSIFASSLNESSELEGAGIWASITTIIVVVFIGLFSIPAIIMVIFGFSKSDKKHFIAAIIAIVLGSLGLFTSWVGFGAAFGVIGFAIAVAMLVGGILYLVGKN